MRRLLMPATIALGMAVGAPVAAETVGVGTMSQGTLSFSTGSVIAKVMKEKVGLEARVQPNTGETIILPLVNQGRLDFGIANVLEAAEAYKGEGSFEGNPQSNLRIASVLYPLRVAFFVRADSDIKTLPQLEGKRITYGFTAMHTVDRVAESVLANAGLSVEDVEAVLVPNVIKGAEQFINERADAFFFAVGAAKVSEVNASIPLRMLSLLDDSEAVARMKEVFPDGYLVEIQPAPQFAGVSEPSNILAYDNLLLTGTHVSDEMTGKVADGLAKNKEDLIAGFPLFRGFNPDHIVKPGMPVPFHSGVEAWHKAR